MSKRDSRPSDPREDPHVVTAQADLDSARERLGDASIALRGARTAARLAEARALDLEAQAERPDASPDVESQAADAQREAATCRARVQNLIDERNAAREAETAAEASLIVALSAARRETFPAWHEQAVELARQEEAMLDQLVSLDEAAAEHHQRGLAMFGAVDNKVRSPDGALLVGSPAFGGRRLRAAAVEEWKAKRADLGLADAATRQKRELARLDAEARKLEQDVEREGILGDENERLKATVRPLRPSPAGAFGLGVRWFPGALRPEDLRKLPGGGKPGESA